MKLSEITREYVNSILDYDEYSGFFTWKVRSDARPQWNARYAGTRAGSVNFGGYVMLVFSGINIPAHRLAWFLTNGAWPEGHIDHANGDCSDNRINNLRECSRSENQQNRAISTRNKSGFTGVSFVKKTNKWDARISINLKQIFLGNFDTAEEASDAYLSAKKKHHSFQPTPRYLTGEISCA